MTQLVNKVVSVLATTDDPAAPGTKVLDNTLIYLFSEIGDGQDHTRVSEILYPQTPDSLPLVTIGKCGGRDHDAVRWCSSRSRRRARRRWSTGPPPTSTSRSRARWGRRTSPSLDRRAFCRGC